MMNEDLKCKGEGEIVHETKVMYTICPFREECWRYLTRFNTLDRYNPIPLEVRYATDYDNPSGARPRAEYVCPRYRRARALGDQIPV